MFKTIILATGGFGHLYLNTNNAPGITGDGQALASLAGVPLQDMEFVQYYPTALERTESRGSHFRSDYPSENKDKWLVNIQVRQTVSGLVLEQAPVPAIPAYRI